MAKEITFTKNVRGEKPREMLKDLRERNCEAFSILAIFYCQETYFTVCVKEVE